MINFIDTQQGDVVLRQTINDGEISVVDGIVAMDGGLETSVYLALFGGNEDDTGTVNDPNEWWGNRLETDEARTYRSATQNLLKSLPVTAANLLRLTGAVKTDLQYLLDENIASSVSAAVTIPALNKVQINIDIEAQGVESSFEFVAVWLNQ